MYSALVYKEKRRPIGRSYWKSYRLVIDKSGLVTLTSLNGQTTKACATVMQASNSIRLCKSKELVNLKGEKRACSSCGYLLMIAMTGSGVRSSFEDTKLAFDSQGDLFSWLHCLVALLQAKSGICTSQLDLTVISESTTLKTCSASYWDIGRTKEHDPFWPMHLVAWPSIWAHFQSYSPGRDRIPWMRHEFNKTGRCHSAPIV